MNKPITIFGREPAVWVGLIEAFLATALAFGFGISQEAYGPIMALVVAIGGAVAAIGTKDTLLGALIAVMKTGFVVLAVYGFSISDQQSAALIGGMSVLFALFQRTQTSPIAEPVDPSPAQVTPSPLPTPAEEEVALHDGDVAAAEPAVIENAEDEKAAVDDATENAWEPYEEPEFNTPLEPNPEEPAEVVEVPEEDRKETEGK
jgi:hypothetical protein